MELFIGTESQIKELVKEYDEGKHTEAEICRLLAISRTTFHKWHQRYGGVKYNKDEKPKTMETDINTLQELLRRAYEQLCGSDDSSADGDTWKSKEQRELMIEIADAIGIDKNDRCV